LLDDDAEVLLPVPTREDKPIYPASIYAINKRDQEEMFLVIGKTYLIPVIALRYFNVFGSRQALSNPYTGVAAIFCSRLLNNNPPVIFEDGHQRRDFVRVEDLAEANILATKKSDADYEVLNIGSGTWIDILKIADCLIADLKKNIEPEITGLFREGDIRHCFSDNSKARRLLGWLPKFKFENSVAELIEWVERQTAGDRLGEMREELKIRKLEK